MVQRSQIEEEVSWKGLKQVIVDLSDRIQRKTQWPDDKQCQGGKLELVDNIRSDLLVNTIWSELYSGTHSPIFTTAFRLLVCVALKAIENLNLHGILV